MKKLLLSATGLLLIAISLWLIARFSYRSRMPVESFVVEGSRMQEEEQPPSLSGFLLMGPPIQTLYFSINRHSAGIQPLNWNELENKDRGHGGYVRVFFKIDSLGKVYDVQARHSGSAELSDYVKNIIKTWEYRPFKYGQMSVTINMANNDFVIEAENLKVVPRLKKDPYIRIRDGRWYFILNKNRVHIFQKYR